MSATNRRSGFTMRPKRNISRLAATISPAMSPTRAEPMRVPISAVSTATATAERAETRRAAVSLGPSQENALAISQYSSGGLSKYGTPLRCGVIQEPPRSISQAIWAWMPSGGSRKGATPRRARKRAAATIATASGALSGSDRSAAGSPLDPDHRVPGQVVQKIRDRLVEVAAVLGLQGDLHLVLGVGELRVRAEQQVGMPGEQRVQVIGERALAHAHVHGAEVEGRLAEPLLERVELLAKDLRHAGQDVDVPHDHRGEDELAVRGELGALRHLRHLETRLVEPVLVVALEQSDEPRL